MLKVEDVTIMFGALRAINKVSLEIEQGAISALIGPNGAGKTTLFNAINGVIKPNSGTITLFNERIDGLPPYQINRKGISRTYQLINLFKNMSVIENVLVGMHTVLKANFFTSIVHTKSMRAEEREQRERAYELLKFVGIERFAYDMAGSLPYGQQRLLEIVRGLASSPKLILLDEPAAGMNNSEKDELNVLMKKIMGQGVTILLVEHDMHLVMNTADHIFVLNSGELISQGAPAYVQQDPAVIAAYLGEDD